MTVAADSPVERRTVDMDTRDLPPHAVIRRLTVCMFLHIVGQSLMMQIYPKVVLEYFDDDDARASQFNGWVTMVGCAVQLFTIPSLSGVSDVFGRRAVIAFALGLHGTAMVGLSFRTSSVIVVAACQVLTGLCDVILPVSQAIIVDISSGEGEERGEISHGLGLIMAAFGLAVAIGPILGGILSEDYRQLACLLSVGISVLALTSLRFYGWSETAPRSSSPRERETTPGEKSRTPCGRLWSAVNPFSVLRVFLGNRLLTLIAQCLFLFALAVNAFTVWYNYFDYKLDWDALEIATFYSTFGLCVAFVTGVAIRYLVPTRLSETQAILMGLMLQVLAGILYGAAYRGWMVYATLFVTILVPVTEPCMMAIMAKLVDSSLTGSLQGGVMSLRILAQGIAGPLYGTIFYFGVSSTVKDELGATIPGLPLFLSSTVSLTAALMMWCSSASLNTVAMDAIQDTAVDEDEEHSLDWSLLGEERREEVREPAPAATVGVAMSSREKEASLQEPLLSSPAASPEDFKREASPGVRCT